MPNTASLTVSITALTRGLSAGLERAKKQVSGFASSLKGAAGAFGGGLIGGLGAAGAVAGLTALTKSSFESIDATTELASRLGVSVEFLSGLQHSADLAGATTEQLGKGFQLFNRTLGEAQVGMTTAQIAFARLGLDFRELVALGPEEAFLRVADSIGLLGTASERAAAAQAIFGRGGTALLDVFAQGSAGIQREIQDARELGRAFTAVDASRVSEADNALIRAQSAATGLGNVLAVELSPVLVAVAKQFTNFIKEIVSSRGTIVSSIQSSALSFSGLVDAISFGESVVRGIASTFARLGQGIATVLSIPGELLRDLTNLAAPLLGIQEVGETAALTIGRAFGATADILEKQASNAFTEFSQGEAAKKVETFFAGLQESSESVGQSLVKASRTASSMLLTNEQSKSLLDQQAARARDIGSAIQIDPTRTAFGVAAAAPRVQEVTSTQLQQLITLSNQQLAAFKQGLIVQ